MDRSQSQTNEKQHARFAKKAYLLSLNRNGDLRSEQNPEKVRSCSDITSKVEDSANHRKKFLKRLVDDHGSIDLEWLRDVPLLAVQSLPESLQLHLLEMSLGNVPLMLLPVHGSPDKLGWLQLVVEVPPAFRINKKENM
ncbi:hypothetical protein KIW84_015727 [Lathyrus oleraceus]|uniref:Uncharacterized protein n=1 Tax=Pisum sativum TaxID=3888 RepID=A0A9D5BRC7_PEA|nr:hypothetical protein KIW84_015727 [Pisum sativum]